MTKETANTLTDLTTDKPANAVTFNVRETRERIRELAGEAIKTHDGKESLVAKLANIAAPYVAACETGFVEIRPVAEVPPKVDADGTVIKEGKPAYLEHVTVPPKPLKYADVSKFIRDAFDIKPEKLEGDEGDGLKSRISYKNTTVDQTAGIAAKAAILIARGADGMTTAYFVGRRAVTPKDGKLPKGATLRLAIPHNQAEPHLKFKGNPIANPNAELIVASPSQVAVTWGAVIEGKQRDAYGKIARGTKAGNAFDYNKAIAELSKAMVADAKDDTAPYADINHHREALINLAGLIDSLTTKAADLYPEEVTKAA